MFSSTRQRSETSSANSRLELPEEFGQQFLITIDTEEEFDWNAPFKRSGHTTVSVPKLERFQQFAEKFDVKPLYFIDYSIVEDTGAVRFLKSVHEQNLATIGIHLHPWINPPFESDDETSNRNSFAGNLPRESEKAKLLHLRDMIEEKIGVDPYVYRAGRYGVGPNTIDILSELGLKIDSSVRSHFDYSLEGGPDFTHLGPEPFWLNDANEILELPLTTVFSGMFRKQKSQLCGLMNSSPVAASILSRTKMLERIPLTPEGITAREAKEAIDIALDDGLRLLVFSFHSPSLSPGHTPYVQTPQDLDRFYDWWRDVLGHLKLKNVAPLNTEKLLADVGLSSK